MGKSTFRKWGAAASVSHSLCLPNLAKISLQENPQVTYYIIYIYYTLQGLLLWLQPIKVHLSSTTAVMQLGKCLQALTLWNVMTHCNNSFYLMQLHSKLLPLLITNWVLSCSHIWIEQYTLIGKLAVTRKFFYRVDFPSWRACGAPLLRRKSACCWTFHRLKWGRKLLRLNYPESQPIISVPLMEEDVHTSGECCCRLFSLRHHHLLHYASALPCGLLASIFCIICTHTRVRPHTEKQP